MPKAPIRSWRIDPKLKRVLEAEARRERITLVELLDRMLRQELREHRLRLANDEGEQKRIRAAVAKCVGSISDGDPRLSENASARCE